MMLKFEKYSIPLLLLILSFLLRLILISKGPFHVDCLHLAINAEKTLLTGKIHYLFGPGYPLTVLLGAFFIYLARLFSIQDPVFAVNFMSVTLSSLCVLVNYSLVKKLFNKTAAFFSSILLSVFPMFLAISVYGKSHVPSLLFLLMGMLCLVNYQKSKHMKDFFVSSLCFGLMGAARLQDLFLMVIPISFFFLFNPFSESKDSNGSVKQKSLVGSFTIFWLLAGLIIILFHLPLYIQKSIGYSGQLSRFWQQGVSNNFLGLFSPSLVYSIQSIVSDLTPLGFIVSLMGLTLLCKKNLKLTCFLLLWLAVPLMFYGNLNTTVPRFLVISVFPLIFTIGYFISTVTARNNKILDNAGIVCFCLVISILFSKIYPILAFRHNNALLPDFARTLGQWTEDDAQIIVGDEELFIRYYAKRKALKRPKKHTPLHPKELQAFQEKLDTLLEAGTPIYITNTGLLSYDPDSAFSNLLKDNYQLIFIGELLSENWHKGGTRLRTGKEKIFKILPKSQ